MPRIEHVIARNLIELRHERGATQYDVAEKMRLSGYGWQTNRVTQIETLRRPVSLIELVGLSQVFNVPVTRLLEGDDDVELPDGRALPLILVRTFLTEPDSVGFSTSPDEVAELPSNQDLRKVAKGLDIDPSTLQDISDTMWGHSFWAEREKRLGDVSGMSKRSAQTRRGHVTRGLIADVREWMDNGGEPVRKDPPWRVSKGGRQGGQGGGTDA